MQLLTFPCEMKFQVVSITFVKGGEAYNVIPQSVEFGGTMRSMTDEGLAYLMKRIKEAIELTTSLQHFHKFEFLCSLSSSTLKFQIHHFA